MTLSPSSWCCSGFSHHHIEFPGTLTSTIPTFMAMMEETIDSLHQHGFSKFLIVNSHGGNNPPISVLLQKLMQDKKYDERGMQAEIYTRFAWAGDLDGPGMRTLGGAVRPRHTTTHLVYLL